jgi:hypothetical protein
MVMHVAMHVKVHMKVPALYLSLYFHNYEFKLPACNSTKSRYRISCVTLTPWAGKSTSQMSRERVSPLDSSRRLIPQPRLARHECRSDNDGPSGPGSHVRVIPALVSCLGTAR